MEQYLSGPNVPQFLKHPNCYPGYKRLNLDNPDRIDGLSLQNKLKSNERKYYNYFNKLNADGLLYETNIDTATSRYYKAHSVYQPDLNEQTEAQKITSQKDRASYRNFLNYPTVFGGVEKPGLTYHATVKYNDKTLIFGGLGIMAAEEYEAFLRDVTDNFTTPPENITIRFDYDYDLPIPLNKEKLLTLSCMPNKVMYQYTAGSNTVLSVLLLRSPDEVNFEQESSISSTSGSKQVRHGLPITTCCLAADKISNKHFLMYGGFMVLTKVYKNRADQTVEIVREIVPSSKLWLYDTVTTTFKEIAVSVSPSYSVLIPKALAKFACGMVSITVEENNLSLDDEASTNSSTNDSSAVANSQKMKTYVRPSVSFVYGGYAFREGTKSFTTLNDLWKCELLLNGDDFADELICTPVGDFQLLFDSISYCVDEKGNETGDDIEKYEFCGLYKHTGPDSNWPKPRGFAAMLLVENEELGELSDLVEASSTVAVAANGLDSAAEIYHPNPTNQSQLNNRSITPQQQLQQHHYHHHQSSSYSKISEQRRSPLKAAPLSTSEHRKSPLGSNLSSSPQNSYVAASNPSSPFSLNNQQNIRQYFTNRMSSSTSSEGSYPRNRTYSHDSSSSSELHSQSGASSPYLMNVQKYFSPSVLSKSIIVFGGSSRVYSKVVDLKTGKKSTFKSSEILGDIWIFNLKEETWYTVESYYLSEETSLRICGHGATHHGKSLMVMGGIRPQNLPESNFTLKYQSGNAKPVGPQAPNQLPEGEDVQEHKNALLSYFKKQGIEKMLTDPETEMAKQMRSFNAKSNAKIIDNSYFFNLTTQQWRQLKLFYINNLKSTFDDGSKLLRVWSPIVQLDSKMLLVSGEFVKLDKDTHKIRTDVDQSLFVGGICEVFSSQLKI